MQTQFMVWFTLFSAEGLESQWYWSPGSLTIALLAWTNIVTVVVPPVDLWPRHRTNIHITDTPPGML